MRVRLIRPSYWTDADLHTRLSAEQREFYVGLWMESDDAGYIAWDLDRIGAELYPFATLKWRRATLPKWVEALAPHVEQLECGKHLFIRAFTKHQFAPRPSFQHQKEHGNCLRQMSPSGSTGDHMAPAQRDREIERGKGREGKGSIRGRSGANGLTPIDDGETEFQRKVARPQ
jgi:hypothetical protein